MAENSKLVTEAEILERIVAPDKPGLPADSARSILELQFDQFAIDRMNELAEKNRQGTITEAERDEIDKYMRVGNLLNLLQDKARLSLAEETPFP